MIFGFGKVEIYEAVETFPGWIADFSSSRPRDSLGGHGSDFLRLNPIDEMSKFEHVNFVIKGGRVVHQE